MSIYYILHISTHNLWRPLPPSLSCYTQVIEPMNKVTATPSSTPTSGLRRMTPRILDSEYIISMWLMLVWGLLKSHGSQTTNMIDINVIQVNGNRQTEIVNYCNGLHGLNAYIQLRCITKSIQLSISLP